MEEAIVLIASGDEPLGEYLYHQLIDIGGTISRAAKVSELLSKVRGSEVDVLLLDSGVEGIPSYDLIPLIKRINSRLPIIALAEDSSLEMSKRVRLEGIFFLAMKPIDPAEIRAAVGDAIKMLSQQAQRRNQRMAKVIELRPAAEIDLSQVREICREHAGKRGDLLIVLQKVQGIFGYVPKPTIEVVAQGLGVSASEIFGVLTFYNRFHLTPGGNTPSGLAGERPAISKGRVRSSNPSVNTSGWRRETQPKTFSLAWKKWLAWVHVALRRS